MYVPAEARDGADGGRSKISDEVLVGYGTDVFRPLQAIHPGLVWCDSAGSIYADGEGEAAVADRRA